MQPWNKLDSVFRAMEAALSGVRILYFPGYQAQESLTFLGKWQHLKMLTGSPVSKVMTSMASVRLHLTNGF